MDHTNLSLLLLDNNSLSDALGVGTFKCEYLTFEEAKGIIESYDPESVIKCFSNAPFESVIYDYLDIENRFFNYAAPTEMQLNQHAIAFKVYVTPSGTQPIIKIKTPEYEAEAKKVQNIYIHCQYIHREL